RSTCSCPAAASSPAITRSPLPASTECRCIRLSSRSDDVEREDAMYGISRNHVFLYHAYALALGGWVRDRQGQLTAINVAPCVLSIAGGYSATSEKNVNLTIPGKYELGERGPRSFHLFVGNAFAEVRGAEEDGAYKTTVRSVLD